MYDRAMYVLTGNDTCFVLLISFTARTKDTVSPPSHGGYCDGFTIRVAAAITLFAIVLYALFEYHTGMIYYQPPTAELVTLE